MSHVFSVNLDQRVRHERNQQPGPVSLVLQRWSDRTEHPLQGGFIARQPVENVFEVTDETW
jgi:hypothetical protein